MNHPIAPAILAAFLGAPGPALAEWFIDGYGGYAWTFLARPKHRCTA